MTPIQRISKALGKQLLIKASLGQTISREHIGVGLVSFSQAAEDLVTLNLLIHMKRRPPFYYVDVGCFEPVRFSNTYFFYLLGGSGLVVDLTPTHERAFRETRPRDTFVCAAVSDSKKPVAIISRGRPVDKITDQSDTDTVLPQSLASLLEKDWVQSRSIDILDIDCEGSDLAVLRSNDWQKFRPAVVLVEDFHPDGSAEQSPITGFMAGQGYRQSLRLRSTSFFVESSAEV